MDEYFFGGRSMNWKDNTVFYEIYISSFADGNQDGIGDFIGLTDKLDYLKSIGINGIWLTPFYSSPKVDQGYDIADYYAIDPDFGTMVDFDSFIEKAHALDIKVIIDIVINHTSTEHNWFKEASRSVDSPYHDFYIWKHKTELNNWESFFGGSAWSYHEPLDLYYYHSFAPEQADLNWQNPKVREAISQMLNFWLDKGVNGFRFDVINNLTLLDEFTDNPMMEEGQVHLYDVNQVGIEAQINHILDSLDAKQKRESLFTVGEISSDNLDVIHHYIEATDLDTTFNFNLGSIQHFSAEKIFDELQKMNERYHDKKPTLFFSSHDMERFNSRFHLKEIQSKALMLLMMTYRSYPFVYFGDEINMAPYQITKLEEARDIQGINAYQIEYRRSGSAESALNALREKSRDYSRNTMKWTDGINGGFTHGQPWINYQITAVESVDEQLKQEDSFLNYCKKLFELRTNLDVLIEGNCQLALINQQVIEIIREYENRTMVAYINFAEKPITILVPKTVSKVILATSNAYQIGDTQQLILEQGASLLIEVR